MRATNLFHGLGLALGALAAAACSDVGDPDGLGQTAEDEAAVPSDLSDVRVIGAALSAVESNLGAEAAAAPQTTYPTSGTGAYILTVTLSSEAHTAVFSYQALTKRLLLNGNPIDCAACTGGKVTIDPRAATGLKRIVVDLPEDMPVVDEVPAPFSVVVDYRTGLFLPGTAGGAGLTVRKATESTLWHLGVIGTLKPDVLVLGDHGLAFNKDLLAEVKWEQVGSTDPGAGRPTLGVVHGEVGNDTLTAGGSASLLGNRGVGGAASYTVEMMGGAGKDKVSGGLADDTLFGGAEDDTFIVEPGVLDDTLTDGDDTLHGGAGSDTIDLQRLTGPVVATLGRGLLPYPEEGLWQEHECVEDPSNPFVWQNGGTDGDGHRHHDGRLQDPSCDPLTRNGEQPCEVEHDAYGPEGDIERVLGTNFNDVLVGGCSSETLLGRGGDDILAPGAGRDVLQGDAGKDTFLGGSRANGATAYIGGTGEDTLTYAARPHGVRVIPGNVRAGAVGPSGHAASPEALETPTEGDQVGSDIEVIVGTGADDYLLGNAKANIIYGGGGDDQILGLAGNDKLYGEDGNDILNGGVGNDGLVGGLGADVLRGDAGADILDGDRGFYCSGDLKKACTLATGTTDCASAGECTFDRFCPPGVSSCDDTIFGGLGKDTVRAGPDVGADFYLCGAETGDAAKLPSARRIKDVIDYSGREGVVTVDSDEVDDDGQTGLTDQASYGSSDRDRVDADCETPVVPTPPAVTGTWELTATVGGGAIDPEVTHLVGQVVELALANSVGAVRPDVVFTFSTAGGGGAGQLLHPRIATADSGLKYLRVDFLPEAAGSYTLAATLGGTTLASVSGLVVAAGQACDDGYGCPGDTHCALDGAMAGLCVPDGCHDGVQNNGEEGVDCGPYCAVACASATCTDGIHNGVESDVDCGGLCDPCTQGDVCFSDTDCGGKPCRGGVCQTSCDGCAGADCDGTSGLCVACASPKVLLDGRCVAACPAGSLNGGRPTADGTCVCEPGKYLSANGAACLACPDNCETCGPGGRCELCEAGWMPNAVGVCVELTAGQCPSEGLYEAAPTGGVCLCQDGHVAVPGASECQPTTGEGAASCPANATADGGRCECNSGYYPNPVTGACAACPAGCTACESDGAYGVTCTACETFSRTAQTPARVLFGGRCELGCPAGTERGADGTCSCRPGFFASGDRCLACSGNCRACEDIGECSLCAPGYRLLEGLCAQEGAMGTVVTEDGLTCAPGHVFAPSEAFCIPCTGVIKGDECVQDEGATCPDGVSSQAGADAEWEYTVCACPPASYLLGDKCEDCSPGCAACESAFSCETCASGYTLWNGVCLPSCGAGLTFDADLGRCVLSGDAVFGCTTDSAPNYNPLATIDDGSCLIAGCTNSGASNYNPAANTDDGSCILLGCTNGNATNFNPGANTDDGSCIIPGCTTASAANYSAEANVDDGSCLFPGCTNGSAQNYNPGANTDDGSCIVLGCTNGSATNFNADANTDDGSCIVPGCMDASAVNYDSAANVDSGRCVYRLDPNCSAVSCCPMFAVRLTAPATLNASTSADTAWDETNAICAAYGFTAPTSTDTSYSNKWILGSNPTTPATSDTYPLSSAWIYAPMPSGFPGGRLWMSSGEASWLSVATYNPVAAGSYLAAHVYFWESYHPVTGGNGTQLSGEQNLSVGEFLLCAGAAGSCQVPYCGDGTCGGGENCSSCSGDCGTCGTCGYCGTDDGSGNCNDPCGDGTSCGCGGTYAGGSCMGETGVCEGGSCGYCGFYDSSGTCNDPCTNGNACGCGGTYSGGSCSQPCTDGTSCGYCGIYYSGQCEDPCGDGNSCGCGGTYSGGSCQGDTCPEGESCGCGGHYESGVCVGSTCEAEPCGYCGSYSMGSCNDPCANGNSCGCGGGTYWNGSCSGSICDGDECGYCGSYSGGSCIDPCSDGSSCGCGGGTYSGGSCSGSICDGDECGYCGSYSGGSCLDACADGNACGCGGTYSGGSCVGSRCDGDACGTCGSYSSGICSYDSCGHPHSISIDGSNDFYSAERIPSTGADHNGYVTWDNDYLYLGMQSPTFWSWDSANFLVAYIGTNESGGTSEGVQYNTQQPTLPFTAHYHFAWKLDNGWLGWFTSSSGWWNSPTHFSNVTNAGWARYNDFGEIRIPREALGGPVTVRLHMAFLREQSFQEWTWGGIPSGSFNESYDPNIVRYLEINFSTSEVRNVTW